MAAAAIPTQPTTTELQAMAQALDAARAAAAAGDVPVGAAIVVDEGIIAVAGNRREAEEDPCGHAEIVALRRAAEVLGSWRMDDVTLVVTLEPCLMCAGAIASSRVRRVVFGALDPKAGACGSLYNVLADPRLHHEVEVLPGVGAAEAAALLSDFFAQRRDRSASSSR